MTGDARHPARWAQGLRTAARRWVRQARRVHDVVRSGRAVTRAATPWLDIVGFGGVVARLGQVTARLDGGRSDAHRAARGAGARDARKHTGAWIGSAHAGEAPGGSPETIAEARPVASIDYGGRRSRGVSAPPASARRDDPADLFDAFAPSATAPRPAPAASKPPLTSLAPPQTAALPRSAVSEAPAALDRTSSAAPRTPRPHIAGHGAAIPRALSPDPPTADATAGPAPTTGPVPSTVTGSVLPATASGTSWRARARDRAAMTPVGAPAVPADDPPESRARPAAPQPTSPRRRAAHSLSIPAAESRTPRPMTAEPASALPMTTSAAPFANGRVPDATLVATPPSASPRDRMVMPGTERVGGQDPDGRPRAEGGHAARDLTRMVDALTAVVARQARRRGIE